MRNIGWLWTPVSSRNPRHTSYQTLRLLVTVTSDKRSLLHSSGIVFWNKGDKDADAETKRKTSQRLRQTITQTHAAGWADTQSREKTEKNYIHPHTTHEGFLFPSSIPHTPTHRYIYVCIPMQPPTHISTLPLVLRFHSLPLSSVCQCMHVFLRWVYYDF